MSREDRRKELHETLVAAAEARIARDGLATLRARDVAKDAGVAVGSIYTVFDDMQALVLEVNARTFRTIGQEVQAALTDLGDAAPVKQLVTMADAYLGYAERETQRWEALFATAITAEEVPEWYIGEVEALFTGIGRPVAQLRPDLSREEVGLLARGLFAAVHGIVMLSIQNRISGVPLAETRRVMEIMLRSATRVP